MGQRDRDQFEVDGCASADPAAGTVANLAGVRLVGDRRRRQPERGDQFTINGPDSRSSRRSRAAIADVARKEHGVVDIDTSMNVGKPGAVVHIDRMKRRDLGAWLSDAAEALRLLVGGDQVTTYNEGGEQYEVQVRRAQDARHRRPRSAS